MSQRLESVCDEVFHNCILVSRDFLRSLFLVTEGSIRVDPSPELRKSRCKDPPSALVEMTNIYLLGATFKYSSKNSANSPKSGAAVVAENAPLAGLSILVIITNLGSSTGPNPAKEPMVSSLE